MRIMKKLMGVAMLAGATIAGAGVANADVSSSITLTTDYVFRGISQSDGGPAVQGSFDWSQDMVYAGAWASNVNFGGGTGESMELDLYVGITPTTGPISWDLSLVGYFYPGADDAGAEFDYYEGIAAGTFNVTEQMTIGGKVAYTPEYFAELGNGTYYEINGGYALSDATSFSAGYGIQEVDFATDSYSTWNVGVSHAMHGFTFGLTYSDTEDAFDLGYSADESSSDGRFVLSVGREL
jgi:uncharacterized protein (TIGR02001 family)